MIRLVALALVLASPAIAGPPSVPAADAPELARLGPAKVGMREVELVDPDRPTLDRGRAPRRLRVTLWYAATPAPGATPVTYARELKPLGIPHRRITTAGIAVRDAPAAPGRVPLVIISHGFGGWAGGMTYLAENLASKGYAVAAIEHDDDYVDAPGRLGAFGRAFMHRSRDQRFVLAELARRAAPGQPLSGLIDPSRAAIIGYSMGGFGALASGGAGYDPAGPVAKQLAPAALAGVRTSEIAPESRLKAIVAIAPWGGQPDNRAWTPGALASVTTPALFIAGDQDDTSNYAAGIAWLFDNLRASDRTMLTYANARHNVGGNPIPPEIADDAAYQEFFTEPVWRANRITAINQHHITAFLDWHLKGDAAKAAYFDPGWKGFPGKPPLGLALRRETALAPGR